MKFIILTIDIMPRALRYFVGLLACWIMTASWASLGSEAAKLVLKAEEKMAPKQAALLGRLFKPASAELSLVERYGEKVKNKVAKDSLKCVANRLRQGQNSSAQKKLSAEEKEMQAKDQCYGGFLQCMDISYKNIKTPSHKMFDRCISEVNTKFEKYAQKK